MNSKKIYLSSECGLIPSAKEDKTSALKEFLTQAKENAEFIIAPGEYYIEDFIKLNDLKNVTISGFGATIISHFERDNPHSAAGAFEFENCENCEIKGFSFRTDNNVVSNGRVVGVDRKEGTLDIKLFPGNIMTGKEPIHAIESLNEDYAPNWKSSFNTQEPYPYKMIAEDVVRIFMYPTNFCYVETIDVGELIYIKHVFYNRPPFNFSRCRDIVIEDLNFDSTAGIIFGIYPRSHNFTFRRIKATIPDASTNLCSVPYDGIHIKGMTGKLIIEDSDFDFFGDDILNIHNTCGTIVNSCGNTVTVGIVGYNQPLNEENAGQLNPDWAQKGDILHAHDPYSYEINATLVVEDFSEKKLTFSNLSGELKAGDKLSNTAYYAETQVRRCNIRCGRSRGLLLRTENITVEDCKFYGIGHSAILICADALHWNEMGPAKNVTVRNNIFENCGTAPHGLRGSCIRIDLADESESFKARAVHKNITVENNTFINLDAPAITALAVEGLYIKNNRFVDCAKRKKDCTEEQKYFVVLDSCDKTEIQDNDIIIGEKEKFLLEI